MTKIKEQIRIAALLACRKLGVLSEAQNEELKQWEAAGGHDKVVRHIMNYNSFREWNSRMDELEVNEQWSAFLSRMQAIRAQKRQARVRVIRLYSAVAAVVLLVVALSVVWQFNSGKSEVDTLASIDIEPGTQSAQLILDNGQVVDLNASGSDVLTEGAVTIANADGVLSYSDEQAASSAGAETTEIKYATNRLSIPRGGEYQLVLPDGSRVWLNSETELSYTVPFGPGERHVNLKGEAYFEIASNKDKPFVVATASQKIEVLGTHFNVSAYTDDQSTVTTLVEGRVKVEYTKGDKSPEVKFLKPSDQLVLNTSTFEAEINQVDTDAYTAWKDGRFVFKSETLESMLHKVSRWYDVQVDIKDESLKQIRFTGNIPRYKNMNSLLKVLAVETSVHVEMIDDKTLIVTE